MINTVTLFPKSISPDELDDLLPNIIHSFKDAERLKSLKVSEGDIMSPGGPPSYSKVIEASFETLEDMMTWVQTPAAQAQKEVMVEKGVVMLYFEVKEL